MIKFKTLTIQNFLSFGQKPTVINLDTGNTTLILGNNKDVGDDGYSRNGTGKTTVFQALTWVLFNEGISAIKQDAFINIINKKNMIVTLEMENDNHQFTIRRGRKPAVCEVLKDGNPYTMHSSATVDDTIEKLLGINFDTWCNAVLLNTTTTPYMGMKPSSQRDFMEKMVGLDILSERANRLKSYNKDILVDIKLEEQNKDHVNSIYDKSMSNVKSLSIKSIEWDVTHSKDIQNLTDEIKVLSDIDVKQILNDNKAILKVHEDIIMIREHIIEYGIDRTQYLNDSAKACDEVTIGVRLDSSTASSKLESAYDRNVSKINETFTSDKSDLNTTKSDKSMDLVNALSEKEKHLSEQRALLKESNTAIRDIAFKLKDMVNEETKLEAEQDVLKSGKCPYCKQIHVDEDRLKVIENRFTEINTESDTIDEERKLIDEAMDDLVIEIEDLETAVGDIKAEKNKITDWADAKIDELRDANDDVITHLLLAYEDSREKISKKLQDVLIDAAGEHDNRVIIIDKDADAAIAIGQVKLDALLESVVDQVHTNEECAEIVSTIKHTQKSLDKVKGDNNPYTEQLESAKKDLVEYDDTELKLLMDKTHHYKILIKLLTDNKSFVRKNLLDQYLPFINNKIMEYTEKLGLLHKISINNDLSVDIEYMTSSISYGNMSNGERNRCNFAVSMAFRDLMSVSGHQFNFIGIDELLDNGLDASGFKSVFRILNKLEGISTFIISHRDELIKDVANTMIVTKENGFSHVV